MAKTTARGITSPIKGLRDVPALGAWLRVVDEVGSKIEPHPSGCWLWTGRIVDGYGHAPTVGIVHRFVYRTLVGPIPEGYVIHHACGVRACCNPAHLVPMTIGDHVVYHAAERR